MGQERGRGNYFLLLKLILIAQIIFMPALMPAEGLGQGYLRPSAAVNSRRPDFTPADPGPKSSSAGSSGGINEVLMAMDKYFGDGTSPAKIGMGKAAIASPFTAGEIVHSINIEEIPAEIKILSRLVEEIMTKIREAYPKEEVRAPEDLTIREIAIRKLGLCERRVLDYFAKQRNQAEENEKGPSLIRDAISMLEVFISHELSLASDFQFTSELIALTFIKMEIEKRLATIRPLVRFADPGHPTAEENNAKEQAARREWKRFSDLVFGEEGKGGMLAMYKALEEEQERRIEQLTKKKAGLERRNAALRGKKDATAEKGEKMAITQIIRRNKDSIRKIKADITVAKQTKEFYKIYGAYIENISRYMIKGWEDLAKQNRTVSDIISKDLYFPLETKVKELGRSGEKSARSMYIKATEQLRVIEDLLGHLHGVEPFHLKAPGEEEDIILFTDKEIGTPSLYKLLERHRRIRGIVSAEGTTSSHWVIFATQRKIPVVILKGLKEIDKKVSDIVRIGNEVILETRKEEGKSVVITRPDEATRLEYSLAAREQELFHKLCLDSVRGEDIRSKGIPLSIYGNAVEPDDAKDALKEAGNGIGLLRTETSLARHASMLQGYIGDCLKDKRMILQSPHRNTFLLEHQATILEYIRIFKSQTGPLTIRTFDIKKDKNKEILEAMPSGEREKEGLDFYKTEIGGNILIIQLAAILSALYIAREEGYDFIPKIIFPMVRTQADMQWIFNEILPAAKEQVKERIKADKGRSRLMRKEIELLEKIFDSVKYGPMIETKEAIENIESIVSDPRINILSVGTNDLIESILSEVLGFKVSRDDEHLERFFFELRPEILTATEKVARAVSKWNKANPNNLKTLGFCGELASREKFLLFALYLQVQYNIPVYLSMPAESIPILEYFRSFVGDIEKEIVERLLKPVFGKIEYRTEFLAAQAVEHIYSAIIKSPEYSVAVTEPIEQDKRRLFSSLHTTDRTAGPLSSSILPLKLSLAVSQSA